MLTKKARLRVLEGGKQQVLGSQEHVVNCAGSVIKMTDIGSACRTSGKTFATSNSFQPHTCFQILLRAKGGMHDMFSLVDLVGNEQGAETSSADQQTHMEGAEMNKTLLALRECCRAGDRTGSHLSRESRPTHVLWDCSPGRTKGPV